MTFVFFIVAGLGMGAIYAGLAASIVICYKGTNVINFAVTAVATIPVFVFEGMVSTGYLRLPIPFLPAIRVGDVPTIPALLVALIVAALLGLLMHGFMSGLLRSAPALAKIVASIGFMIVAEAATALTFGTAPQVRTQILTGSQLELGGIGLPADRLVLVGIVVAVGVALGAILKFTRTGIALRAAAEDLPAIRATGIDGPIWVGNCDVNAFTQVPDAAEGAFSYSFFWPMARADAAPDDIKHEFEIFKQMMADTEYPDGKGPLGYSQQGFAQMMNAASMLSQVDDPTSAASVLPGLKSATGRTFMSQLEYNCDGSAWQDSVACTTGLMATEFRDGEITVADFSPIDIRSLVS